MWILREYLPPGGRQNKCSELSSKTDKSKGVYSTSTHSSSAVSEISPALLNLIFSGLCFNETSIFPFFLVHFD